MPKSWLRERRKDYYYKKAKEEQYRSRAAYKLLQVIEKHGFIKTGDIVVDLGAAPGGWLQAARKTVGESGLVLGIDIKPVEPLPYENVEAIVGDITENQTAAKIKAVLPRKADAVISDVAPNVSGVWELDHAKQVELAVASLRIAAETLKQGGNFLVKVFQGDMLDAFLRTVHQNFGTVKIIKPKASRTKSAEIYILGMRFNPQKTTSKTT